MSTFIRGITNFYFLIILITLFVLNVESIENPCDIPHNIEALSSHIEFSEDAPVGSILFQVPFVGEESEIDIIDFTSNELDNAQLSEHFTLNFKNLTLKRSYDVDSMHIDLIEILFTCRSKVRSKGLQQQNTFLLYLTVNDINDNAPKFSEESYKFSVKEMTPIGTIVDNTIKAIDNDLPDRPNSQISFRILDGPFSDYFEFPLTSNGKIAVAKQFNYDTFTKCSLLIQVYDHGTPQLSSNTTVEINVIDTDDKDPKFSTNFYIGHINSNSKIGTQVNNMRPTSINAFDQDFGINMTVEYYLTSNPHNMFKIDKTTGQIYLKNLIKNDEKKDYNLIVKAAQTDNPLRSTLAMINIAIIESNDFGPVFEKHLYHAEVVENCQLDTIVCTVRANDKDKNKLEYSIKKSFSSVPFEIDKELGIIRVKSPIDYETQKEYNFDVLVNDGGNTTDIARVQIKVVNVLDTPPKFQRKLYHFKIDSQKLNEIKMNYQENEHGNNDVYVGQVKAFDVENSGNQIYYYLKYNSKDQFKDIFCISKQTGKL
jgi:hypothetical protein